MCIRYIILHVALVQGLFEASAMRYPGNYQSSIVSNVQVDQHTGKHFPLIKMVSFLCVIFLCSLCLVFVKTQVACNKSWGPVTPYAGQNESICCAYDDFLGPIEVYAFCTSSNEDSFTMDFLMCGFTINEPCGELGPCYSLGYEQCYDEEGTCVLQFPYSDGYSYQGSFNPTLTVTCNNEEEECNLSCELTVVTTSL